jgi:hypothetical protein
MKMRRDAMPNGVVFADLFNILPSRQQRRIFSPLSPASDQRVYHSAKLEVLHRLCDVSRKHLTAERRST